MKLKKGFVTHWIGDEQLMVAAGPAAKLFHGLVRSNETAAFIVDQLKRETDPERIVAALLAEYDGEESQVREDVKNILTKLRSIGALED